MVDKPVAASFKPPAPAQNWTRLSKTQLGKRPQNGRSQQCDTYIPTGSYLPTDTYIPDYGRPSTLQESADTNMWIDNPRASIPPVPPSAQSPRASSSTDISNNNTTMIHA